MLDIFLTGLWTVLAAATAVWVVSLPLRDASIVDVFWGLGFVLVAGVYRLGGPPAELRQWLLLALVAIWGLRLAGYIFWRSRGRGEDRRYTAMRDKIPHFAWLSLPIVFWFQAVLVAIISLPHLVVQAQAVEPGWRWSDIAGLAVWLVGFTFEALGDAQMARFKADPDNRGKVMRSGLWRYTRHPNYFGDAMVWWGFWLIALGAPGGAWTVVGPVIMTVLLLKVSGVALLERDLSKRRPEYRDYVESTSAFIPWFPKRRRRGEGAS
jgi:steroid 5-alpha reductase family enzyme